MGGDTWSAACNFGNEMKQLWIGQQHREQLYACGKIAQKPIELGEGGIGIGGFGQCFEQCGHQLGEAFARTRAAHGADPTVMPAANGGRDVGRPLETQLGERFQGFWVFFDTGKDEASAFAGERRFAFE